MRPSRRAGIGARAVVVIAAVAALAAFTTPSSAVSPGQHVHGYTYDCVFTAWQTEPTGPTASGSQLEVGADLRCTNPERMVIRLHVTDGVDDVAAIAGPPNPLLGIDAGPSVGTVVAPYTAASDSTTQLAVTGHVPVPRPGHVYTVNAVAELTSGCGRNPCASYPAAPPPPAAPGVDLTPLQQTDVCTTTTDTYDGGCQFEFTVAGA